MKTIAQDPAWHPVAELPEEPGRYLVWEKWPEESSRHDYWMVGIFFMKRDTDGTVMESWWAIETDDGCRPGEVLFWMYPPPIPLTETAP